MFKSLENRLEDRKQYLGSELREQQNLFSKELLEYLKALINLEISVVRDSNLLFLSKIEFYKDIVYHNLKGRALVLFDTEFRKNLKPMIDIIISENAQMEFSADIKDYKVFSCIETPERFEVNLYDCQKDLRREKDRQIEGVSLEEKYLKNFASKKLMEDFGIPEDEDFSAVPSIRVTGNEAYINVASIVDKGPNLRIVKNTKHY